MKHVDLHRKRFSWLRSPAARTYVCGLILFAGCGRGYRSIDMRGSVSVDGVRANAGHLTFMPESAGMGRGGMAAILPDGTYHLRNVPLGDVTFTLVPEKNTGRQVPMTLPSGGTALADEVTPMIAGTPAAGRGQVTVRLQVTAELRQHDFALQATGMSAPPPR